ncbi:hypothetical protein FCH28_00325 [Streptomyces piniterrae]|uniref:Hemerythrin domain-containing protein n=1 Tax=Streptomyces piniterrae TaxID=2571125 RepID=A0A4U0NVE2_9ACTN|nr:hypothetical protein [Streptomyces piniterrae]TJZ58671.1 hypothetical protein FCH28_00325 [Streptomyces piniterrae]
MSHGGDVIAELTADHREVDELFSQFEAAPPGGERRKRLVDETKKTAPTRPRPSAPSAPPANKLLAPGLGLVDRARDYLTGRGQ